MTGMRDKRTNSLRQAYLNVTKPEPSLEFMRAFYFEHCTDEEQAWIDTHVLTMIDKLHAISDTQFSPSNVLEILGALVLFREETQRPRWKPMVTSADVQARRVRNGRS